MPLEYRLNGITAKIQRANESVQYLNTQINTYLTGDPRPYTVIGGLDNNCTKYVFKGYGIVVRIERKKSGVCFLAAIKFVNKEQVQKDIRPNRRSVKKYRSQKRI